MFGYVIEGEYELGIDDQPAKILKAGQTFYEPTMCLHRVYEKPGDEREDASPGHHPAPRNAEQVAIPESKSE